MEHIQKYVEDNYKQFKDKKLIIREYDTHYTVQSNIDSSPLILSKDIV